MRQLRDVQLGDVAEASVYGTLRRLYRAGLLTSRPAVLSYLSEVGEALRDLAPVDRGELLDEVQELLLAIVDESAGHVVDHAELVTRLGTPVTCAAELRAAVGLLPRAEGDRPVRGRDDYLTALPAWLGRSITGSWTYIRSLSPAWWAMRGYLIAGLVMTVAVPIAGEIPTRWRPWMLDSVDGQSGRIEGAGPYIVIVIAAIMVISIRLGLRRGRPGSWEWLAHHACTVAGAVALVFCPMWWLGPSLYAYYRGRYGSGS